MSEEHGVFEDIRVELTTMNVYLKSIADTFELIRKKMR